MSCALGAVLESAAVYRGIPERIISSCYNVGFPKVRFGLVVFGLAGFIPQLA
jgi:hypothetical protein